jgi:hypothetical protein
MKNEQEMYKKAKLRKDWVDYLRRHEVPMGQWTSEKMEDLYHWTNNTWISSDELKIIIQSKSTSNNNEMD